MQSVQCVHGLDVKQWEVQLWSWVPLRLGWQAAECQSQEL